MQPSSSLDPIARSAAPESNPTATVAPAPASGDWLVEARGILKRFGATDVLKGVDFSVRAGEVHALLGGNGAGKSTLIKIITGLLPRDGGDLSIAGVSHASANPVVAATNLIAVVHQEMALLPHLTVAENVALPLLRSGRGRYDRAAARASALEALSLIDAEFAARALDRKVQGLGLHERQLVEIARTLASGARLLLLDEPTANLTASESQRLFDVLQRLVRSKGIGVVFVSHRMREIRQIADVCSILRSGRTVVDREALGSLSDADIVDRMGLAAAAREGAASQQMSRRGGGGKRVVLRHEGVAFDLPAGGVIGLAGAPSGPSALIDQLVGTRPNGAWEFQGDGLAIDTRSPAKALRSGVGYVSGDRANKGLLLSLPIIDNLMASRRVLRHAFWVRAAEKEASARLIESLAIKTTAWQLPSTLSGGTQQKLLIARWTALAPKVLVLEEPTRGVDIATKREIYVQIRAMADAGTTVFWWSTEGAELAEVCDAAIGFDPDGRPTAALTGADITEQRLAEATGMAG